MEAEQLVIEPPDPTAVSGGAVDGKDRDDADAAADDDDDYGCDNVSRLRSIGQERKASSIAPTIVYYLLLFAGAYGFAKGLWPLTESRNALASFG